MKKLIAILACLTFTQLSQASSREFRVNAYQDSVVNGYAIAWGVPGESLDFEALDKLGSDEAVNYVLERNVANYIVDLETNTILDDITTGLDREVELKIAGTRIGNHFHLGLTNLHIDNLGMEQEVVGLINNSKWSNELAEVLVVDRQNVAVTAKRYETTDLNTQIEAQIEKKLQGKSLKLFKEGARNLIESKVEFDSKSGKSVNIMTFDYSIPKSDEASLEVKVVVGISLKDNKLSAQVYSIKKRLF